MPIFSEIYNVARTQAPKTKEDFIGLGIAGLGIAALYKGAKIIKDEF